MGEVPEPKVSMFEKSCQTCDLKLNLKACGGCYAVFYCSNEHQKADWKSHRTSCREMQIASLVQKASELEDVVVLLEVKSAEGYGLKNHVIHHFFNTKAQAVDYVAERFKTSQVKLDSRKLTEMPFLTEILGWTECELYVNPKTHEFFQPGHDFWTCSGYNNRMTQGQPGGERTLNSTAIYLGVSLTTVMSRFFDAIGTAFFMGKRNGRYVTGNMLYGALLMIHDATEKAGSEDDSLLIKIFKKWGQSYAVNKWTPECSNCHDLKRAGEVFSHEFDESTSTGKAIHNYEYKDHRQKFERAK